MTDVDEFSPIDAAVPPSGDWYLLTGLDRGDHMADWSPDEALPAIVDAGRDGAARRNAPKLGWCWAGNRHTWLGFASAARRWVPGS